VPVNIPGLNIAAAKARANYRPATPKHMKPKDLVGIPWMVAFALRKAGWYLRQDIIWSKPSHMPESVTDRCTKAHEYIFLLSRSPRYYYDHSSIMTDAKDHADHMRRLGAQSWANKGTPDPLRNGIRPRTSGNKQRKGSAERGCPVDTKSDVNASVPWTGAKANKRSVWVVTPRPFAEAHFATFPPELIVDCIKAGCPEGGIVLDPFMGAGTTALVAAQYGRKYIGFELNPEYVKLAERRLEKELGLLHPKYAVKE
jgi:DNA modification methylase